MKRFLVVLAVIAAWAIPASTDAVNSLTPKEAAQGWKMLWDGKTMDGWKVYGNATWTITDGALVSSGPGGWLGTADDYSNFIVKAEFRTNATNINSGIYLRRSREDGDSHMIGYEMQIRNPDPKDKPYDGKPDNHNGYYTGSFSGHLKSHNEPIIEMGKWNTAEVTAQGDHFIVVINGTKVLDDHHPAFKSGAIGLQHTGQTIEFRNFKIKTL